MCPKGNKGPADMQKIVLMTNCPSAGTHEMPAENGAFTEVQAVNYLSASVILNYDECQSKQYATLYVTGFDRAFLQTLSMRRLGSCCPMAMCVRPAVEKSYLEK